MGGCGRLPGIAIRQGLAGRPQGAGWGERGQQLGREPGGSAANRAAPPKTSRSTGRSRVTTGTPAASASIAASPKPSLADGNANTLAAATSDGSSLSATGPRTRGSVPSSAARLSQRAR